MTEEDRERFVRMETKLDANAVSLSILFKGIEGNGQPGLKDRMTGLETTVSDHLALHAIEPQRQGNIIQWVMVFIMVAAAVIQVTLG